MTEKDTNSLEHTEWRGQYRIVFAPKYRRQVIYREMKAGIGEILSQIADQMSLKEYIDPFTGSKEPKA